MLKAALPEVPEIRTDSLRDANSFLLSAICHLVALVLLGLFSMSTDTGWTDLKLFAQMGDGVDAPLGGDDSLDDELGKFKVELDPLAASAGAVTLFDSSSVAVSDVAAIESPLSGLHAGGLAGQSIGDGGGGALGGGAGEGAGGAKFFGIGGQGGSIAYVVDLSGSMNEQGKFERARDELLRSIEHLSEDQLYFVIFYNDGWFPMPGGKPIRATARNVDRTRRWVRRTWPGGGTFPLAALQQALSLEPDAIYFLSDGKFDPAVIDALRISNPASAGQIPIHTIAFVNEETIDQMRAIAKNSGGKFRFVK